MNPRALDERIIALIADLTGIRPAEIKPRDRLREDLGMDSVTSMELLSLLAEELDLDIPVEEAVAVTTVEATLAMARRHAGAAAR